VNIEAVTSAIDRRNGLVKELSNMHAEIEEKSLKFKKDATVIFHTKNHGIIMNRMEMNLMN